MSSVHYIGHGRLESAPENFSILHVISHELGHVNEFKKEAIRENADIAEIRVKIDYEMLENGKLVAVSGETSAVTRKRPEEEGLSSLHEPYTKQGKNSPQSTEGNDVSIFPEEEEEENSVTGKEETPDSKKKADEWNRLAKKESLETRLEELNNRLNLSKDHETPGINPEETELERERRKIEEEIRLLEMEEDTKKNFQLLAKAQRDLRENAFQISTQSKEGNLLYAEA